MTTFFLLKGPKPEKLGDHCTGPHKVLEIINKSNVKIQFKGSSKIVHANRLKISHINHEVKCQKYQEKGAQKMNNCIHVLITDVAQNRVRLADPNHSSVSSI